MAEIKTSAIISQAAGPLIKMRTDMPGSETAYQDLLARIAENQGAFGVAAHPVGEGNLMHRQKLIPT